MDGITSDLTRCPVCLEDYCDPRSLPCLHSFCRACLERLCENEIPGRDPLDCAVCRATALIPVNGVDGFPHNFMIQSLLDAKHNRSTLPSESELSSTGDDSPLPTDDTHCQGCQINGVALLSNELYILRYQLADQIDVYSCTADFTLQRRLSLPNALFGLVDIASCTAHGCLYVSDCCNNCIHRLDPLAQTSTDQWDLDSEPWCISVMFSSNVLVACHRERKLLELSPETGDVFREIELDFSILYPCHAVELSRQHVAVCHNVDGIAGGYAVSLVEASSGATLSTLANGDRGTVSNAPRHLAVDDRGRLLAANLTVASVTLVDSSVTSQRFIAACSGGWEPHRICLHFSGDATMLYVAENRLKAAGETIRGRVREIQFY